LPSAACATSLVEWEHFVAQEQGEQNSNVLNSFFVNLKENNDTKYMRRYLLLLIN